MYFCTWNYSCDLLYGIFVFFFLKVRNGTFVKYKNNLKIRRGLHAIDFYSMAVRRKICWGKSIITILFVDNQQLPFTVSELFLRLDQPLTTPTLVRAFSPSLHWENGGKNTTMAGPHAWLWTRQSITVILMAFH